VGMGEHGHWKQVYVDTSTPGTHVHRVTWNGTGTNGQRDTEHGPKCHGTHGHVDTWSRDTWHWKTNARGHMSMETQGTGTHGGQMGLGTYGRGDTWAQRQMGKGTNGDEDS
jgi:hypothetical protein